MAEQYQWVCNNQCESQNISEEVREGNNSKFDEGFGHTLLILPEGRVSEGEGATLGKQIAWEKGIRGGHGMKVCVFYDIYMTLHSLYCNPSTLCCPLQLFLHNIVWGDCSWTDGGKQWYKCIDINGFIMPWVACCLSLGRADIFLTNLQLDCPSDGQWDVVMTFAAEVRF